MIQVSKQVHLHKATLLLLRLQAFEHNFFGHVFLVLFFSVGDQDCRAKITPAYRRLFLVDRLVLVDVFHYIN